MIRTATHIHRLRHGARPSSLVINATEYRRAHLEWMTAAAGTLIDVLDVPPVYVTGNKWCVVCVGPSCANRPVYGWGLACCFDCGRVYEGLTLPEDASEIDRLLTLRPHLSQRGWEPGQTLDDLRDENTSIGVPI